MIWVICKQSLKANLFAFNLEPSFHTSITILRYFYSLGLKKAVSFTPIIREINKIKNYRSPRYDLLHMLSSLLRLMCHK